MDNRIGFDFFFDMLESFTEQANPFDGSLESFITDAVKNVTRPAPTKEDKQQTSTREGKEFVAETWTTQDEFVARLEAPGMRKEDLTVQMRGRVLTVKGFRGREDRPEWPPIENQFYAGVYTYTKTLNDRPVSMDASLSNGILTVTITFTELPHAEENTVTVPIS